MITYKEQSDLSIAVLLDGKRVGTIRNWGHVLTSVGNACILPCRRSNAYLEGHGDPKTGTHKGESLA